MAIINHVTLIFGGRGTGKTTYGKTLVKSSQMKKKFIVDTFDHPSYKEYKDLNLKDLNKKLENDTYHLWDKNTNGMMKAVAENPNFWNSLIVFEDATKYLEGNISEDVKMFILDTKQKNINLVFMFHDFNSCPPRLFKWCDFITVFKTKEVFERQRTRISCYDLIEPYYNKVKNSSNPYEKITLRIT